MTKHISSIFLFFVVFSCQNTKEQQVSIAGLEAQVNIIRDQWGINHIYAENQRDLFFAQGYAAASDRLFQFEIWRRQATGTVAEILGEKALERDYGTRLFRFRGDMQEEMAHYHPDGVEIIEAFVAGVNAYIDQINQTPEQLPETFKAMGIQPQRWTPEVVISRHQGLLGNIGEELQIGRAAATLGPEKVKELLWLHPQDPDLVLDQRIPKELLFEDLLAPYYAYRSALRFELEDVVPEYRAETQLMALNDFQSNRIDSLHLGSNNWVVSGKKMKSGMPFMANDPHRTVATPSLRYMVHLNAPGWDVIGGGEPEIPGVSIGHNTHGAWGLTVFRTDGEDLMIYRLNPQNPDQYLYQGKWENFEKETTTIAIKDQEPVVRTLMYTRHGPVTYIDKEKLQAVAVRCAWQEVGGAPYLASLRMDQATDWESFRAACNYSNIPGENMIWADRQGNIGWQAVGIAPIRENFSGLVPIPGDGSYEWAGYLPIIEKPHAYNPPSGFIATANQNVTPSDYTHWNAIGYSWSDPYRGDRVNQVLAQQKNFSMEDMRQLQVDYTSLPAQILVPLLSDIAFEQPEVLAAMMYFKNWDYQLTPDAIAAAIYVSWEQELLQEAHRRFVPEQAQQYIRSLQLKKVIDLLTNPTSSLFGKNPQAARNEFLKETFKQAISELEKRLGKDPSGWRYGQADFKHSAITHALGTVVKKQLAEKLNHPALPRGGNAYTPGSTGSNDRQSSGATFRILVDTNDWDMTLGTNSPGQSGDPESPFYNNLYKDWAEDRYFPLFFSKEKIEEASSHTLRLVPSVN